MRFLQVKHRFAAPIATAALVFGLAAPPALAQLVSLPGSDFEIDTDADLIVDEGLTFDWANVAENRQTDAPSGGGDDAFGQGSKEDTPVPSVVSGSIPPNKSDLLNFGVFLEETPAGGRFLHMFWRRINNPSGTTNMDFEFNQSEVLSGNGVTPVRTSGDLLAQYDLASGGENPELFLSKWIDGSEGGTAADCEASNKLPCWEARVNLTTAGLATGSINTSTIPAAEADGLGEIDPFTFGEATVDFNAVTSGGGDECVSFGSAYLKSRSSDSFTAALKDFIAPVATGISNCGKIVVTKVDDADPPVGLSGAIFHLLEDNPPTNPDDGQAQPDIEDSFVSAFPATDANGMTELDNIFQGDYWVCEITAPAGHELADPPCQPVTVVADETVELSFEDPRIPATINIIKTDDDDPANPLAGAEFTLFNDVDESGTFSEPPDTTTGKTCTTDANGECTIIDILPPGFYCVVETVTPANHDTADPQCLELSLDEEVTLNFTDPRHRGAILISKTRKHAADGPGDHPHAGVDFTITGGDLAAEGVTETTDVNGQICVDDLLLSAFVGDYTVTENVPAGYVADDPPGDEQTVSVTTKSTCGDGNEATVGFSNTPLTNITVSVDSQVDGGTASTIECELNSVVLDSTATGANGDGSLTLNDLEPGTYICTIVVDP